MIVPIENKSAKPLTIMLEPLTFTVEIQPGQVAELVLTSAPDLGELQFDYHDEQWLSIWVPPHADIRIRKD